MPKIGRNSPCPCGSGKKYKRCCLPNLRGKPPKNRRVRNVSWDLDEIRDIPTQEIVMRLREFGVDFVEEQFAQDVNNFYSACHLADHWREAYPVTATGFDEDFIWMAAIVLWERLAPHVINSEQIDNMMQDGYDLQKEGRDKEACDVWLAVWEHLKRRFTVDMRSIHDAERVFSGMQALFNWCQDLEEELRNAGVDDPSYHEKNIKYCEEFCSLFPDSDTFLLGNMRRSAAESYFALGLLERGEKAFEALVEELPDYAWGYIGWGDMYWLYPPNGGVPLDPRKAEKIYRMGLNKDMDDEDCILERLEELKRHER